jgi:hypothetical protein
VLDARGGRCSVTREVQERATVTVGPRHDRARVERLSHRLIGRDWMSGPRQGLRWLCAYVADNAAIALPPADVRALFAPVMQGGDGFWRRLCHFIRSSRFRRHIQSHVVL